MKVLSVESVCRFFSSQWLGLNAYISAKEKGHLPDGDGLPREVASVLIEEIHFPTASRAGRCSTVERNFGPRPQRENSTTRSRNFKPESPSPTTGAAESMSSTLKSSVSSPTKKAV